jgi:hypothetical protein
MAGAIICIHLTAAEHHITVKRAAMSPSDQLGSMRRALVWRPFLVVLLAILLLYNPFLGGAGFGDASGIGRPASHRGTVGASELQHFANAEGRNPVSAPDIAEEAPVSPLPELNAGTTAHFSEEVLPALPFFCASLWFRPPPAR